MNWKQNLVYSAIPPLNYPCILCISISLDRSDIEEDNDLNITDSSSLSCSNPQWYLSSYHNFIVSVLLKKAYIQQQGRIQQLQRYIKKLEALSALVSKAQRKRFEEGFSHPLQSDAQVCFHWLTQSFIQSIIQSFNHSIIWSFNHSIIHSLFENYSLFDNQLMIYSQIQTIPNYYLEEEKPYVCGNPDCSKRFSTFKQLQFHCKDHPSSSAGSIKKSTLL